jgi:glycosyltransferase involved in cell wall biosynthesis
MLTTTPPTHILLVSGIYYPDIGGPATFVPKLAENLQARGFRVSTLALTDSKNFERPPENWNRTFIQRKLKLPLRFLITVLAIRKKSGRHSQIFSNGLYEEAALASLLGCKLSVAKIVGDPIWERYRNKVDPGIGLEEFNQEPIRNLKYILQRKFLVWSLNRFNVVTTPSQQLSNLVATWGVREKAIVIANGIQVREVSSATKDYDVISVSRLVSWKNVDKIIHTCSALNFRLAIVGSGPEENRLKALAAQQDVVFLGDLDNDQVFAHLSKSRVFALLSNYEGLSHSLLEAMNLEIPVIVSNTPGNMAVIQHERNGIVVDLNSESELVSSFKKLVTDGSYAKELAQNAKQDIRTYFNLERQLEQFVKLLRV